MHLQKKSLLNVGITTSSRADILSWITSQLVTRNSKLETITIVTPNPEQVMLAQKNAAFGNILNDADIALPDGAGVVWAINRKQKAESRKQTIQHIIPAKAGIQSIQTFISRLSGVDFMEDLCQLAAKYHWPVAFIGGKNGVAGEALSRLQKKYPGLTGFADEGPIFQFSILNSQFSIKPHVINSKLQTIHNKQHSGNINEYIADLVKRLRERNIRIVFVGMGAPKQEFFISMLSSFLRRQESGFLSLRAKRSNLYDKDRHILKSTTRDDTFVLMGVGGSFDMVAEKIHRAPKVVQQVGFEWLWRLIHEPWRIHRQRVLASFVIAVLKESFRLKNYS